MSAVDLSDLIPEGHKPKPRKAPKVDLSDLFESGPPPEPEIFSPPLALELHLCRTHCRCGETFTAPEGAFVEVVLKRLHYVGYHHYYKEFGHVLIPITAERSQALASVPHRTRVREVHVVVCHLCLDRADLYRDTKPESFHEWEVKRPKLYSQAWRDFQNEVNPTKTKLLELIEQIERREALKDDRSFAPGVVGQIYNRLMEGESHGED